MNGCGFPAFLLAFGAVLFGTRDATRTSSIESVAQDRGRDPWVFRALFEDRTRMLLIAAGDDWWFAFNPDIGGWHRVWQGSVDFRGKVWDFSQDNSRATGETILAPPDELLSLREEVFGVDALDWQFDRVIYQDGGWRFDGANASITSPDIDLTGWLRLYLAFDERSRSGPIRVEVLDASNDELVIAQWFDSTMHGSSDTDWQWNFKRITPQLESARIRFVQREAKHSKSVRAIRLFGDRAAWFTEVRRDNGDTELTMPEPVFRGYQLINQTEAVVLEYDLLLPDGRKIALAHRADRRKGAPGVEETIIVRDKPEGVTVIHACPKLAEGWTREVDGARALRQRDPFGRQRYALTENEVRIVTMPLNDVETTEEDR